jgi:hypothetical protein
MPHTSRHTKVIENIAANADRLRQMAAKSTAIPVGQERLSRGEARTRAKTLTPHDLGAMTPEQRQMLIKEVGTQAVVDIVRRGANA